MEVVLFNGHLIIQRISRTALVDYYFQTRYGNEGGFHPHAAMDILEYRLVPLDYLEETQILPGQDIGEELKKWGILGDLEELCEILECGDFKFMSEQKEVDETGPGIMSPYSRKTLYEINREDGIKYIKELR